MSYVADTESHKRKMHRSINIEEINFFKGSKGSLKIVNCFCNLGNIIGKDGGCSGSILPEVSTGWKNFQQLLPLMVTKLSASEQRNYCMMLRLKM